MRTVALALALVACAPDETDTASVDPLTPELAYGYACAYCHGDDGRGSQRGPDLSERIDGLNVADIADIALEGSGFMDPVPIDETEAMLAAEHVLWLVGERAED